MIVKSLAKINLYLNIYERYENNYHGIDSLACFAQDVYDELEISESTSNKVVIIENNFDSNIEITDNIVTKILNKFCQNFPLSVNIKKNIPISAGLGGGSANAASVIKYIYENNKFKISTENLSDFVKDFGSDIPICLQDKASYFMSSGEIINQIDFFPEIWSVIVNPRIQISTSEIFKKFNLKSLKKPHNRLKKFINADHLIEHIFEQQNDLQDIVINELPEIKNIINQIKNTSNCLLSRMSGSGASCFGLYKTRSDAIAAKQTLESSNNWWIAASKLI